MRNGRLSEYVSRPVDEAVKARHWSAIQERLEARERRRAFWRRGLAFAGAAVALAGVVAGAILTLRGGGSRSGRVPSAWNGAVLETGSAAQTIHLSDGSVVVVAPRSRIAACERHGTRACVRVLAGRAEFLVRRGVPGAFVVRAADVTVRVVGTRFTVAYDREEGRERVSVSVMEGIVEVSGGGTRQLVRAGQRWSKVLESVPRAGPRTPAEPAEMDRTGSRPGSEGRPAPRTRAARRRGREGRATRQGPSADVLWGKAMRERRAGRYREAARTLEAFLRIEPHGGRGLLAAYLLAKIRMDALRQPARAIPLLRRVISSAGTSAFREDALARLARAYHRLGRDGECRRYHRRYLREYPKGIHRFILSKLCPLGGLPSGRSGSHGPAGGT